MVSTGRKTLCLYGFAGLGKRAIEAVMSIRPDTPVEAVHIDVGDEAVLAYADLPPGMAAERAGSTLGTGVCEWGLAVWGAGGTGARLSYLFLSIARKKGASMLSFVVTPFSWEGRDLDPYTRKCMELFPYVLVENDLLLRFYPHLPMLRALEKPFEYLVHLADALSALGPGCLRDLSGRGGVGYGRGVGREGATVSLRSALSSPFVHGDRVALLLYRGDDEAAIERALRDIRCDHENVHFLPPRKEGVHETFILTTS